VHGEGDDDNVRRRGKPLIEHKWSCQAWRVDQCCMNTFKSCMKDHGSATIRRYVRKSSSITLNEALCGRQPGYTHTHDRLHGVVQSNHQVTLYHCSNKYHNTILFNLIAIEGAHWYLISTTL
jgi:hypothetical protein